MTGSTLQSEDKESRLRHFLRRVGGLYRDEWAVFRTDYKRYFKMAARILGVGFVLGWAVFYFRPELAQKGLAYVLRSLKDIPLGAPPLVIAVTLFYHNSRASLIAAAAGLVPFVSLPVFDPLANGAALGLIAAISGRQGLNVPMLFLKGVAPHGIFEIPAVLYATSIGIFISVELGKKVWAVLRGAKGISATGSDGLGHPILGPGPNRSNIGSYGQGGSPSDSEQGTSPANSGSNSDDPQGTVAPPGFLESYPRDTAPNFGEIIAQAGRSFALIVLPLLLVAAFIEAFFTPLLV